MADEVDGVVCDGGVGLGSVVDGLIEQVEWLTESVSGLVDEVSLVGGRLDSQRLFLVGLTDALDVVRKDLSGTSEYLSSSALKLSRFEHSLGVHKGWIDAMDAKQGLSESRIAELYTWGDRYAARLEKFDKMFTAVSERVGVLEDVGGGGFWFRFRSFFGLGGT